MTNQQNVLGIKTDAEFFEEMNKVREIMRSAAIEQSKDEFSTGFVLLEHPLTQMNTATASGEGLANCIVFSDENTNDQIVIQLSSTNAVIKYLIPLFVSAEMLKKLKETGERKFSPYELGLIDKLLEMKQRFVEKGVLRLTSEEIVESSPPNEAKEANVEKEEA